MKLEDILPFVAPFARSLAEPTIFHHVKLASVEFASRTHLLREVLEFDGDGEQTDFDLIPDAGLEPCKVVTVWVGDEEYDLTSGNTARRHLRASGACDIAYSDDRQCLSINPAPASGQQIRVEIVVRPKLTDMRSLDERLRPHLQDIAHGALAGLLSLKGADQDPDAAGANRAMFNSRVATVGLNVSRGFANARTRGAAQFF